MKTTFLTLDPGFLSQFGLPSIGYPSPGRSVRALMRAGEDLSLPLLLYWLQNHSTTTPDAWLDLEPAMDRLSVLLENGCGPGRMIVAGGTWSFELGPVDLDAEIVTIQRDDRLLAAVAPRPDGTLRVATYRPLDGRSISLLQALAAHPGPEGVERRPNNWEYALDASAGRGQVYAAHEHRGYLSYWEFGLGRISNGATSEVYCAQRGLSHRPFPRAAAEIATYARLEGLGDKLPPAKVLGPSSARPFCAVPAGGTPAWARGRALRTRSRSQRSEPRGSPAALA